jgi:hypothetical protein
VELRKALVGSFYSGELDARYDIGDDGDRLVVEAGDRAPVAIAAVAPDRLRIERGGATLVPERDASGRVNGFTLDAGRVRGLAFTRR